MPLGALFAAVQGATPGSGAPVGHHHSLFIQGTEPQPGVGGAKEGNLRLRRAAARAWGPLSLLMRSPAAAPGAPSPAVSTAPVRSMTSWVYPQDFQRCGLSSGPPHSRNGNSTRRECRWKQATTRRGSIWWGCLAPGRSRRAFYGG
jgi:hypothetical protein